MLRDKLNLLTTSIVGSLYGSPCNISVSKTQNAINDMRNNGLDVPNTFANNRTTDKFTDIITNNTSNSNNTVWIVALIEIVVFMGVILLCGKYLFNNILVKVIPCIKPVNSVWQLLGLIILFDIAFH